MQSRTGPPHPLGRRVMHPWRSEAIAQVARRLRIPHVQIRDVMRRDPCAYCGEPSATLDHIVAQVNGGGDTWENLTGACLRCNTRKSAHGLLWFLLLQPMGQSLNRQQWRKRQAAMEAAARRTHLSGDESEWVRWARRQNWEQRLPHRGPKGRPQ